MQNKQNFFFALFLAFSAQLPAQLACDNASVQQFASTLASDSNGEQRLLEAIGKAQSCSFDLKPSSVKALKASSPLFTESVLTAMEKKMDAAQAQAATPQLDQRSIAMARMAQLRTGNGMAAAAFMNLNVFSGDKQITSISPQIQKANMPNKRQVNLRMPGFTNYRKLSAHDVVVPGTTATTKIRDEKDLYFSYARDPAFTGPAKLFKADVKNGERKLYESVDDISHAKGHSIELKEEEKDGTIKLTPMQSLAPGEYAVVISGIKVFCFEKL